MKSILKNNVLNLITVFLTATFIICLIQSCSNDMTPINENCENFSQNEDLQNYSNAFNAFKMKTFEVIESMTIENRAELFNNLNNDDYMVSFVKEYDLIDYNLRLQKEILSLKQNQNWSSLDNVEKYTLFCTNIEPDIFVTLPRLRSGEENEISACEKIFNEKAAKLYVIASLDLIGCTCFIEVPPVTCLCYVTIITKYYLDLDTLVKEKEECEKNI